MMFLKESIRLCNVSKSLFYKSYLSIKILYASWLVLSSHANKIYCSDAILSQPNIIKCKHVPADFWPLEFVRNCTSRVHTGTSYGSVSIPVGTKILLLLLLLLSHILSQNMLNSSGTCLRYL